MAAQNVEPLSRARGKSGEFPQFLSSDQKTVLQTYLNGKSILITGGTGVSTGCEGRAECLPCCRRSHHH